MLTERTRLILSTALVLTDETPRNVDVAIVPSRSYGDMEPILDHVSDLVLSGRIQKIILPGVDGERFGETIKYESNAGKIAWAQHLDENGVNVNESVFFSDPGYHTRQETDRMIEFLLKYRHSMNVLGNGVMVVAHPHQLPRIVLGMIKRLNQTGQTLKVYPNHPPETNWNAVVKGSQGIEEKPRIEGVQDEFSRILRYQLTGDVASYKDLLEYYKYRDGSLTAICFRVIRNLSHRSTRNNWITICKEIQKLAIK